MFVASRIQSRSLGVAVLTLSVLSCTSASNQAGESHSEVFSASTKANFRLSLTDAPIDEVKSVFVNINHAELRVEGKGKKASLQVARDLGAVDLLTLQNGVTLPMADVQIPDGVSVTQIRLILNPTGHYLIRNDGSRCDLQTPSAQKTGVKLLMKEPVQVDPGFNYGIVADFDARKSLVLKGNGECLLKPVLKLKSAQRQALPEPGLPPGPVTDIDDGSTHDPETDDTTLDPNESVVDDFWEPVDPADLPLPVSEREIASFFAE